MRKLSLIVAVRLVMTALVTINLAAIFTAFRYWVFDSVSMDTFERDFINIFMYACLFMTFDEVVFQIKNSIKNKTIEKP